MSNLGYRHRLARNERADMGSAHFTTGMAGARGPRFAAGIAAGLALVILAACGGGDDGEETDEPETTEEASGSETTSSDDTTTTEDALPPEEREVLDAYEASIEALIAASDPANPDHPDLLATHTGDALFRLQTYLGDYQVAGTSEIWLSNESQTEVLSLVDDTARLEDCYKEVTQLVDTDTREPREEPKEQSALTEVQMERIDGTWIVVEGQTKEESCDPDS